MRISEITLHWSYPSEPVVLLLQVICYSFVLGSSFRNISQICIPNMGRQGLPWGIYRTSISLSRNLRLGPGGGGGRRAAAAGGGRQTWANTGQHWQQRPSGAFSKTLHNLSEHIWQRSICKWLCAVRGQLRYWPNQGKPMRNQCNTNPNQCNINANQFKTNANQCNTNANWDTNANRYIWLFRGPGHLNDEFFDQIISWLWPMIYMIWASKARPVSAKMIVIGVDMPRRRFILRQQRYTACTDLLED
jgi:hypothetical protein